MLTQREMGWKPLEYKRRSQKLRKAGQQLRRAGREIKDFATPIKKLIGQ